MNGLDKTEKALGRKLTEEEIEILVDDDVDSSRDLRLDTLVCLYLHGVDLSADETRVCEMLADGFGYQTPLWKVLNGEE